MEDGCFIDDSVHRLIVVFAFDGWKVESALRDPNARWGERRHLCSCTD